MIEKLVEVLRGNMMEKANILQMSRINKSFSGIKVLFDVDFSLKAGEVRALVGENGAGKSTLIKVLGGIYPYDSGQIFIDNKEIQNQTIDEMKKAGVAIIHQEIVLVQDVSISENIFMGHELTTRLGTIDFRKMNKETKVLLEQIGLQNISPETLVRELSISQQQMVEIARALSSDAKIIVMDEPTSSLTDLEVQSLFNQIRVLKEKNVAIVYISHKMDEIFTITDSITIMRDGHHILTTEISNISYDEIIEKMVGRDINEYYPPRIETSGEEILTVENMTTNKVKNVNFKLHKGEILGIAGLVGAGRTEMVEAIFGVDTIKSGQIYYMGKPIKIKNPYQAIKNGIAFVPEDRKLNGLFLENTIAYNMTISIIDKFIKFIFPNYRKEKEIVSDYIKQLSIKMRNQDQLVVELSGGNQQKVVFSKWLATTPKVLILDEPTRGIDVGAKSEIYHLMNKIAENGVAIIMISSELPEVLNLSTRIGVMCEGELVKIFDLRQENISQEDVMRFATGGYKNDK